MRRLLYCLLGSTLFHGVLLWVPFPMSAGGAGENALQAVRVRLVDPPRSEARVSEPNGPPRRAVKTQQAKAEKPRPMTKRPQAASRPRTQVVKALPEAPSPVPSEPTRSRTVAKKSTRQARPEPARHTRPVAAAKVAGNLHLTGPPVPAREPRDRDGADAANESHLARAAAPATPDSGEIKAAGGLSPVRYARTVKPRYPGKARRAGWEGTTVLKVRVTTAGTPDRVTVDRTSGFDILDAAAVKAVRHWKFHPARRGIEALSSWVRVPVAFKLKENR